MNALDYPLPELDVTDRPLFVTATAAKEWATTLPLANPGEVQQLLIKEIEHLNRYPVPARERLAILDTLRKAVSFAQEEAGKRYIGKALPLIPGEQHWLTMTQRLRRACLTGTVHCLEEALASNDRTFAALVLQRALVHLASLQVEGLRGGQALLPAHWRQLHQLLALAECRDLHTEPVKDTARYGDTPTTALAAYGEALLLQAASPFELSARQLAWVARWVRRWGSKLVLATTPPENLDALPLAVDLHSDLPPRHRPFTGAGARLLWTHALRDSLKSRIALLGQGRSPADLQLGDDCSQPASELLLKFLYPRWCKDGQARGMERHPENSPGRVLTQPNSLYYYLSGGKYLNQAPVSSQQPSFTDLRKEREHLAMFGSLPTTAQKIEEKTPPPPLESGWQCKDESAIGLRLARPLNTTGCERLRQGQLLAVEPPGAKHFLLAVVRWLRAAPEEDEGWLHAGVQLLPGPVEASTLRPANSQDAWRIGYFLPPLPIRHEEASVLIPTGIFRTNLQLQLPGNETITLTSLLDRGEDFDRVLYT
jgi:hypothetical protein